MDNRSRSLQPANCNDTLPERPKTAAAIHTQVSFKPTQLRKTYCPITSHIQSHHHPATPFYRPNEDDLRADDGEDFNPDDVPRAIVAVGVDMVELSKIVRYGKPLMISEPRTNVHLWMGSAKADCALRDFFDEADRDASFNLGPAERG